MSRYPPLPSSQMPADIKPFGEDFEEFISHLAAGPDGGPVFQYARASDGALIGPYPVVIASKKAGKGLQNVQTALNECPAPAPDVRVAAILAVAAKYQAEFAKYSYTDVGKATAGLSDAQIAAMRSGKKADGLSEAAQVAWDLATFLLNQPGPLPEPLYQTAVKVLGKEAALVIANYVGMYSYICTLENFADVPYPEGINYD